MSHHSLNFRRKRRQRKRIIMISLLILFLALGILTIYLFMLLQKQNSDSHTTNPLETTAIETESESSSEIETTSIQAVLDEASVLAAMYDYDGAIEKIKSIENYSQSLECLELIDSYTSEKSALVKWPDNTQITHIFFHSLIVDTDLAFSSAEASEYNQVMVTVDEFKAIIQSMYDKGYVLVSLHDIAQMETGEDGTEVMTAQDIYLPDGKIPFVLSVDDVCYYEYMDGDGFASKLIIGEDGKVTNEMILEDGSVVTGSYDVLPILEDFIEEHPDFSYKGAKGILALTGYAGVFGYRTSDFWYTDDCDYYIDNETNTAYKAKIDTPNLNIEADKETAKAVAQAIRNQGWELASHSWGHRDYGTISYEAFVWDADIWEKEVESIIGDTDIILFPFGADIGTWRPYEQDNERFQYLKSLGFDYFCNVDSAQYWIQIGSNFFRQGRRNIDGQRMWEALSGGTDRLSDLFDVASVFDPARPTPVE